jgi:hypothetical protein
VEYGLIIIFVSDRRRIHLWACMVLNVANFFSRVTNEIGNINP